MPLSAGSIATSPAIAKLAEAQRAQVVPHFVGTGFVIAFLAVTMAGFAQAASAPAALVSRAALPGLALVSCLYAALGTLGLYAAERRGTRAHVLAVIGLLVAGGSLATFASHGYMAMLLLGAVSVGVFHAGPRGSALVTGVSALTAMAAFALRSSLWSAFLQAGITFGSGIAFVFVFSRIALREQRARSELERLAAALASANQRLQEQAEQVEQLATIRERNRIAREIHDGLAHALTVVHIQLEAAQTLRQSAPERARQALVKAQQLAHEGLAELRRSVSLLRDVELQRPPLLAAIELLTQESSAAGVAASLLIEGKPRRLAEPTEFTLYRAAQEALTNVRRHARASRVQLTLAFGAPGSVRLSIQDDGVGAQDEAPGFGLLGLRERVELAGGTVAITTAAEQGFRLELEVPG
jgi:signal transduction histidine kinase